MSRSFLLASGNGNVKLHQRNSNHKQNKNTNIQCIKQPRIFKMRQAQNQNINHKNKVAPEQRPKNRRQQNNYGCQGGINGTGDKHHAREKGVFRHLDLDINRYRNNQCSNCTDATFESLEAVRVRSWFLICVLRVINHHKKGGLTCSPDCSNVFFYIQPQHSS